MPAIMELSLVPLDKEQEMSRFLARNIEIIKASGLPHGLGPLSASIEGEWDELMALADRCYKDMASESRHIEVIVRIIWRQGRLSRKLAGSRGKD